MTTGSVIATHYGKYGELLKGHEAKPMLDNDEIAGDIGDGKDTGDA